MSVDPGHSPLLTPALITHSSMEYRTLEDIMAAHAILQLGAAFAFKKHQQEQQEQQEEVLDLSLSSPSRASLPLYSRSAVRSS